MFSTTRLNAVRNTDQEWMEFAITLAVYATHTGQRPFASVIVNKDMQVLAVGAGSETEHRPTRHSELLAIERACREIGGLLHGCTLFNTHEPCVMCAGAIAHSKLSRLVYGSSRSDFPQYMFRHKQVGCQDILAETYPVPEVVSGVLRAECIELFDKETSQEGMPHNAS